MFHFLSCNLELHSLSKKTALKISLNPGLNLTIFLGTGPCAFIALTIISMYLGCVAVLTDMVIFLFHDNLNKTCFREELRVWKVTTSAMTLLFKTLSGPPRKQIQSLGYIYEWLLFCACFIFYFSLKSTLYHQISLNFSMYQNESLKRTVWWNKARLLTHAKKILRQNLSLPYWNFTRIYQK